jgi:site-specific recombinase XerD
MITTKPLFSLVQSFFDVAMPQRGWSHLTAISYRDAIKLLLRYVMARTGRPVVKLDVADLTPEVIRAFLTHLEADRGNQVATRNTRLAALRAFFLYVAIEEPVFGEQCRRICALPLNPSYAVQEIPAAFSGGNPAWRPGGAGWAAKSRCSHDLAY